ncbi:ubiquitinyl hydrolase [Aureococcus anophagefferens]|nr:ubiquitinyl hydrolase [Aureococcus anophagefferens]
MPRSASTRYLLEVVYALPRLESERDRCILGYAFSGSREIELFERLLRPLFEAGASDDDAALGRSLLDDPHAALRRDGELHQRYAAYRAEGNKKLHTTDYSCYPDKDSSGDEYVCHIIDRTARFTRSARIYALLCAKLGDGFEAWAAPHRLAPPAPAAAGRCAGLVNLGNTCFLNATIQCLAHAPGVAQTLGDESLHAQAQKPDVAVALRDALGGPGRQEDAHEFLLALLDAVEPPLSSTANPVRAVFGGRTSSTLRCPECDYESATEEPFLDLSLEPKPTLARALDAFTAPEELENDEWCCRCCGERVRPTKRLGVAAAPKALVVHLNRYDGRGGKIEEHVAFEPRLELETTDGGAASYGLVGVLVHRGQSTRCGHYTAFCRTRSGAWSCFDDAAVRTCTFAEVLRQEAYMLFYARDARPSLGGPDLMMSLEQALRQEHKVGPTMAKTFLISTHFAYPAAKILDSSCTVGDGAMAAFEYLCPGVPLRSHSGDRGELLSILNDALGTPAKVDALEPRLLPMLGFVAAAARARLGPMFAPIVSESITPYDRRSSSVGGGSSGGSSAPRSSSSTTTTMTGAGAATGA